MWWLLRAQLICDFASCSMLCWRLFACIVQDFLSPFSFVPSRVRVGSIIGTSNSDISKLWLRLHGFWAIGSGIARVPLARILVDRFHLPSFNSSLTQ